MYQALEGEDVEVACAVLELIARDEDQTARPHIRRLLARLLPHDNASPLALKAQECLRALHAAAGDAGAKLLRPSEAPADEALLRPAAGRPQEDPAYLLRSHEEP